MRDLSWYVDGVLKYSDDDVRGRLHEANYGFGARFDILNRDLSYVGPLETVLREAGSATVEFNSDRGIPGAMNLQCWPEERLRGKLFNRYVRPWIRFNMWNGDIVEYPMGVYLVTAPQRDITYRGSELWTFNGLPDFAYLVDSTGPGTWGVRVSAGTNVTDAVKVMFALAGFFDHSGETWSPARFPEGKTWIYLTPRGEAYDERQRFESQLSNLMRSRNAVEDAERRGLNPEGQELVNNWHAQVTMTQIALAQAKVLAPDNESAPVTYWRLINEWLTSIGFEKATFDLSGRPRTQAVQDLSTAPPRLIYETNQDSIIEKLTQGTDAAGWFNKAIGKTQNSDALYTQIELDANNVWPNHPLAQKWLGFYRDQYFEEGNAETEDQLRWRLVGHLQKGLMVTQSLQFTTDPMPCHEAYEVLGIKVTDDPDLNFLTNWSERMWAIDLYGWRMEHGCSRLFQ